MGRVFLISFFLLVLPFVVYGCHARIVRGMEKDKIWYDAPVIWLGIVGVVSAVAGLVGLVYLTGM